MTTILAELFDAQGHRVTASVTRSGLLTIVTQTLDGKASGHPCLSPAVDQAVKLRDALNVFLDDTAPVEPR